MSKFKVGDELRVISFPDYWESDSEMPRLGETCRVKSTDSAGVYLYPHGYAEDSRFELAEDRTNWHPHHDVIMAWAKGAKVQSRPMDHSEEWQDIRYPHFDLAMYEWRVKPETDHTAEIAEIERKMRELSEDGKRLADRLEKLKL